jgi:glycosyltransferase involved in cell wall biosynthesis
VPAVLTSCPLPDEAGRVRARCGAPDGTLVGHFGTYGPAVAALLAERLTPVLRGPHCPSVLLVGAGSTAFRARFAAAHPDVAPRVHAVDRVPDGEVAQCLAACDLLVQPYPDGISSRRTSAMAGLSLGRPIVTTRGPLTEPIWEASGAVWLSDVADVVSFVAQVDRLLDDAPARQRLGDQARVLYGARFDLRHTISALRASDEST